MTKTNQTRVAIFVVGIVLLILSMVFASLHTGMMSGSLLQMNFFILTIATLVGGLCLTVYSVGAPKSNIDNLLK